MLRVQHRLENTVTLSGWMNSPVGKAALGLQYFLARRGPLSAQPTLLAVFARTLPGLDIPDVQIHVSAASYAHVGGPLHPFPGMTSSACILRPTSRGHVRIRSSSAAEPPAILHNFLRNRARSGCRRPRVGTRTPHRRATRSATLSTARIEPAARRRDSRANSRLRAAHDHDRLPSGRDLRHGPRAPGCRRRAAQGARYRRPARRRRVDHADNHLRQHLRSSHHDRRESGRYDCCRSQPGRCGLGAAERA